MAENNPHTEYEENSMLIDQLQDGYLKLKEEIGKLEFEINQRQLRQQELLQIIQNDDNAGLESI
jgi:hypothetical protein